MKKLAISLLASSVGLIAAGAHAADGTITITGELAAQTCIINGNGNSGANFTVALPDKPASLLSSADSATGETNFTIDLTGCDPDSGSVHTFFEYGLNTLGNGRLKNTLTGTGAATNVEVQLLNGGNNSPIDVSQPDLSQNHAAASISSGSATLSYIARYYSTSGGATAGNVETKVIYSLSYQ